MLRAAVSPHAPRDEDEIWMEAREEVPGPARRLLKGGGYSGRPGLAWSPGVRYQSTGTARWGNAAGNPSTLRARTPYSGSRGGCVFHPRCN